MKPTSSRLTEAVRNVIKKDLPHRRAGYPSTWRLSDIALHLCAEAKELSDAIELLEAEEDYLRPASRTLRLMEPVYEELADCHAIIEHFRQRLELSKVYLDTFAAAKVQQRFHEMFASSFPPKEDRDA
jgi:predicted transcriptional regulator